MPAPLCPAPQSLRGRGADQAAGPVRHVQAHGLAHHTSGCSARRGLEPSPPAFPAGPRPRGWWTGWSLSRLTPESRDWTRKQKSSSLQTPRSSSHLGPRGSRCPATPGCRWVGSLLPVHSTCPTPVSRGARLPLSLHVAWGTVPAKTPPAPAHGPAPQSLRFECQLKKTKAVSYCGWSMSQTFNCTVCAAYSRRWPAKSPGTRA